MRCWSESMMNPMNAAGMRQTAASACAFQAEAARIIVGTALAVSIFVVLAVSISLSVSLILALLAVLLGFGTKRPSTVRRTR